MAKFCAECGERVPENAKFCPRCGTKVVMVEGDVDIEQTAVPVTSTDPAVLELKAAFSIIREVEERLIGENFIEKPIAEKLDNNLKDADNLIEKAGEINPDVAIKDPISGDTITIQYIRGLIYYYRGLIEFYYSSNIKNIDMKKILIRKAQKKFIESNKIIPSPGAQYYIAHAMDAQTQGIIRIGEFILDENGKRVFLTPLASKKAKKIVHDAYQKVIDIYPDSEWAVEARKRQTELRI